MAKESAQDKVNEARAAMANPDSGLTPDADDAEDNRGIEHPDAQKVRDGELSAAQMEGGAATINPDFPDAQYPPGHVDTGASARAEMFGGIDPYETLPEGLQTEPTPETTDISPDYK